MLPLILAACLQASAAVAPVDPAKPPPTTVAPVTAEGQIVYGVIEGKGQPKSKRVCFNDAQSGSKIPTKRCMDREAYEQRQRDAREHVQRIQSDARAPISR
jgi:hypothetical protein